MTMQALDDSRTKCVWFKDIDCPIRQEIANRQRFGNITKPKDEAESMMSGLFKGMQNSIPMDLSLLPHFCSICHLRKNRLAKEVR